MSNESRRKDAEINTLRNTSRYEYCNNHSYPMGKGLKIDGRNEKTIMQIKNKTISYHMRINTLSRTVCNPGNSNQKHLCKIS